MHGEKLKIYRGVVLSYATYSAMCYPCIYNCAQINHLVPELNS